MKTFMMSLVCVCLLSVAQAADTKKGAAAEKSLYDRLGGKKAITAVVDEFVNNCATDPKISSFFADTAKDPKRLKAFKTNLIDQICQASGGPCKYKGKSMSEAHAKMGVKDDHFSALVADLVKALDKFKVPQLEKDQLIGAIAPLKGEIVGK